VYGFSQSVWQLRLALSIIISSCEEPELLLRLYS
jgi:hypothetical protein